ncbi:MAG: adenylate/guanylate cyclase domain-containing protein [Gaiellales bacterium]
MSREDTTIRRRPEPLPHGTVSFVFTDIEGSTQLLRTLGGRYGELIAEHARLIREALGTHGGWEVDTQGDAFFCVFGRARDAVNFSVSAQRMFAVHRWPCDVSLRVRMAVHTGEPDLSDQRYYGIDVHRTARICSIANGREVVLSELAASLVRDQLPESVALVERGVAQLKDFPEPVTLYRLHIPEVSEPAPSPETVSDVVFRGAHDELGARVAEGQRRDPSQPEHGVPADTHEILVVGDSADAVERLLPFATAMAAQEPRRGLILTSLVAESGELLPTTRRLAGLREVLGGEGILARVAAFRASDAGDAIEKLAVRQEVGLVVVGAADLVEPGGSTLSAEIVRLSPCDVALHIAHSGGSTGGPVIVPFAGSEHDWAALELAAEIAAASNVTLVLTGSEREHGGGGDASRLLAAASLVAQRLCGIIAEPMLIAPGAGAVVDAAHGGSHLITGVPPGFEERGLGESRREIAGRVDSPVTFVRRGARAGLLSPDRDITQFSWTQTRTGGASSAQDLRS